MTTSAAEVEIKKVDPMEVNQVVAMWKAMLKEVNHPDLEVDDEKNLATNFFMNVIATLKNQAVIMLVSKINGKITGFLYGELKNLMYSDKVILYADSLYVKPEYRNGSSAGKLVDMFEKWGQAMTDGKVVCLDMGTPIAQLHEERWLKKGYNIIANTYRKVYPPLEVNQEEKKE